MPYLFKTLQRYKRIRKRANNLAKKFVSLTFVCFGGYIYTNFKHKNGKVCKCTNVVFVLHSILICTYMYIIYISIYTLPLPYNMDT